MCSGLRIPTPGRAGITSDVRGLICAPPVAFPATAPGKRDDIGLRIPLPGKGLNQAFVRTTYATTTLSFMLAQHRNTK
jgi:hypothetical protein